jgi:nucleotide-binding universal stress UspA family protein
MFQRILVPVDGSITSFFALDQALWIAAREQAVITTLCVIDARVSHEARVYLPVYDEVQVSHNFPSRAQATLTYQAWADQISNQVISRAAAIGVKVHPKIVTGIPYQEISTRSATYDLLAMGIWQPARTYPGPFLAGQTLQQVIAQTRLPLLYVPNQARQRLQTILVAYDESYEAQDALQLAATWAQVWELTLVVLTIQSDGRYAQTLLKKARQRVAPVVPRLVSRDDEPMQAILTIARKYRCDLIALGAHVHRSIFGNGLGQITNDLLLATHLPLLLSH